MKFWLTLSTRTLSALFSSQGKKKEGMPARRSIRTVKETARRMKGKLTWVGRRSAQRRPRRVNKSSGPNRVLPLGQGKPHHSTRRLQQHRHSDASSYEDAAVTEWIPQVPPFLEEDRGGCSEKGFSLPLWDTGLGGRGNTTLRVMGSVSSTRT